MNNNKRGEYLPEQAVVEEGNAADAILAFAAKQKSDGIVMGTHGLRGYDRLVLIGR